MILALTLGVLVVVVFVVAVRQRFYELHEEVWYLTNRLTSYGTEVKTLLSALHEVQQKYEQLRAATDEITRLERGNSHG